MDTVINCWFATDRYLNSFYPDGKPRCGLTEEGQMEVPDPYVTHIAHTTSDCEADLTSWWNASPQRVFTSVSPILALTVSMSG